MISRSLFFCLFFFIVSLTSLFAQKKSLKPSDVISPDVPKIMIFCDDTIDLTRFDIRESMDRELLAFSYMHSTTLKMIKKANRYFPVVAPILKDNGIPEDMIYLMAIESSVVPKARSYAGAAGLWQLMTDDARSLGLEVNSNIDERYNIEKSTLAACKYLKHNYQIFNNWFLVALSYNRGLSGIKRDMNSQQTNVATDLYLNSETSKYIYRILACKYLFQDPSRMGFKIRSIDLYPPLSYTTVKWTNTISSLAAWAKQHGTNYKLLKLANPWLLDTSMNDNSHRTYYIKIYDNSAINYDPRKTKVYDSRWVTE